MDASASAAVDCVLVIPGPSASAGMVVALFARLARFCRLVLLIRNSGAGHWVLECTSGGYLSRDSGVRGFAKLLDRKDVFQRFYLVLQRESLGAVCVGDSSYDAES